MIKFTTTINKIEDLKTFCNTAARCVGNVDVKKGKYLVDGKSLMGLMSIDMSSEVTVELSHDEDLDLFKEYMKEGS